MWQAIAPKDANGDIQKAFYDAGVGTEGGLVDRLLGGASGLGLDKNIQDGYRFLMHTYEPGDKIYLFGFSRGAYTVRSLAGFLRNSGLLHMKHSDRFNEAFELYRSESKDPKSPDASKFRAAYSQEVDIEFIGVWDTVGALGIPTTRFGHIFNRRHLFHDVELSGSVKRGYQVLAIDERRRPFRASIWGILDKDGNYILGAEPKIIDAESGERQDVEQVWFAGYHSDVGGGTSHDDLSDVAFEWMRKKAESAGLVLDEGYSRRPAGTRARLQDRHL
jgi:uncharacterized protein (DUF2235 family)